MSGDTRTIALVSGHDSASRASALEIAESLTAQGFAVTRLSDESDLIAELSALQPDVVFNNARGTRVGAGRLQSLCEANDWPYTHSGFVASAVADDRHLSKMVFKAAGIPVTDHVLADRSEVAATHVLPPPYIVKSRFGGRGGAPVIVRHIEELVPDALMAEDWDGVEEVMVERFVPGDTLSVYIMGDVVIGTAATTDATKTNASETLIPATISPKIYEECTRLALRAHGVLECRGVTALTLRHNPRQAFVDPIVLALETLPDISKAAPLVRIAARAGHSFDELLRWIVEDASCERGS